MKGTVEQGILIMTLDRIIVALFSASGIVITYWFFLMKKDEVVTVEDSIEILVDGGYSPSTISVTKDKTTKISFFRKDPSTCLEEVVLADFKIRKFLPLNQKTIIEITPKQVGEFNFSCGMGMFHGKILVTT